MKDFSSFLEAEGVVCKISPTREMEGAVNNSELFVLLSVLAGASLACFLIFSRLISSIPILILIILHPTFTILLSIIISSLHSFGNIKTIPTYHITIHLLEDGSKQNFIRKQIRSATNFAGRSLYALHAASTFGSAR